MKEEGGSRGGTFSLLNPLTGVYALAEMKILLSMLAVGAGGFVGSGMRYGLSLAAQRWSVTFPHGTLWANILGCLLLGGIMALAVETDILSSHLRLFLATGLCGGFTTMSTFMYEFNGFARESDFGLAALYFFATLAGCAVAFWLGSGAIRWLMKGA